MESNPWVDWSDSKFENGQLHLLCIYCIFIVYLCLLFFLGSKLSNNPLAARQRNVAQQRRRMETEGFQKLGAVLPISRAISEQHIDKTTIVRLASSYIKLHHLLGFGYGSYGNYDYCIGSLIDVSEGVQEMTAMF